MGRKSQKGNQPKDHGIKFSTFHFAHQQTEKTKNIKPYNNLQEVNQLGSRYARNPTSGDADLLIQAFHGFLMKYVQLLSKATNKIALSSDTKDFLKLFISRNDFQTLGPLRAYQQAMQRLPNMAIQSLMNPDDLYNELVIIFLEKAQQFNPDIGGFTGYMKYRFKYAVKGRLFQVQNDPINYQPLHDPEPEDLSFFGQDTDQYETGVTRIHNGYDIINDTLTTRYIDLPELTPALINNPPAPFDTLWTKQERAILVKIYVEDKHFSSVAHELGYSNTKTIIKMHENALNKFRDYFKITKNEKA